MSDRRGIWGTPRDWALDLAVATGIGVFLGILGPFGSFNGGPVLARIFYWTANLWIGLVMLSVVMRWSLRMAGRLDLPVWFALAAGAALGAVPLSLALAQVSARFWPGSHGDVGRFLDWYAQTLAIAAPCTAGYYFILRQRRRAGPPTAPSPVEPAARFVDRLPARLGQNLLCLQMEDHYVRAHTDLGSDLILTPLKDAVAELTDIEGLQVHRSWWVARRAVAAAIVKGRNHSLRLTNGLEVPVSRTSVAKARALGWL
jgi:hypothetical protein